MKIISENKLSIIHEINISKLFNIYLTCILKKK